jgi:hypothetical protein
MSKLLRNTLLSAAIFFCLANLQQQLYAQAVRNAPQPSELRNLTRRSGAIFAGRVLAVQLLPPRFSGEVPTVRVTFRVERGIRGPRTGTQFVLRSGRPSGTADNVTQLENVCSCSCIPRAKLD